MADRRPLRTSGIIIFHSREPGTNKVAAARNYADHLRRNRRYYGAPFSRCDEDIIIFLSYEDRVVSTLGKKQSKVNCDS